MSKTVKINIELAVLFAFLFAVVLSFAGFDSDCDKLRQGVLRLHVIANSDSEADQELKLKVRDAVLETAAEDFKGCTTVQSAETAARNDIDKITEAANAVIKENGFSYNAKVSVKDEYFDTREYDKFTLPAGNYTSLVVRLGEAEGHNWWCVVFPGVCLPTAEDRETLEKSVDDSAAKVAYNADKYIVKFKTAEIYERIKAAFAKK